MSILSAQSIRALCLSTRPLIRPFSAVKQVVNGKSYGLSASSYDVRIAQDVLLWPKWFPWAGRLASTLEYVIMPYDVQAVVRDKSTYARLLVSAFNTHIDPGFRGYVTLELVNHSWRFVRLRAGDPIVQLVFERLDAPTELPYKGKYQNQRAGAVPAIMEKTK